ncbi:MAG TPA: SDR family oxidoreductase [Longimicrobium sp.]|nr:SDR family oxidoreductase [Longimicrobium sp.]
MSDRVALITGGAGGLGRAVTAVFLADGWRVAVPVHGQDGGAALRELSQAYPHELRWASADLATEEGAEAMVDLTLEWAGRLDAVVHTVGGYAGGQPLAETPVEQWDRMMSVNLRSAFLVARAAIPRLHEGGTLVFVSARAALKGRRGHVAYAVSKSALVTLVEGIAEDYRGRLRANAVLPGTMDTPANRAAMPDADFTKWTPTEEVARVILFLAGPRSAPVSGTAVPVYGDS